jgi:mono/diheme cytochrome c family protein
VIQPSCARAAALGPWRVLIPSLFLTALACFGCNERPSDVREWRPGDHDHTENPGSDQVQVDPQDAGAPAVPGFEDVTLVAWKQNCTPCHGAVGRGDGPRGPMLKATNLTDAAWQGSVTDEQIAKTIKLGKGAMPAFNLPDVTIANLVKLVRILNAAKLEAHAQAAASAAAASSASPTPSGTGKPLLKSSASPAPKPSAPAAAPKPSAN